MKRTLLLLLCVLVCLPLCAAAFAEGTGGTLDAVEASYTLGEDGACSVELTVRPGQGFGSFDFPIPGEARGVSVEPGGSIRREDGQLTVTLQGTQESHIRYALPETVVGSSSGQELELKLLLPTLDCAIKRYSAVIRLPKAFEELPEFKSGYHGDNIDNYMRIDINEGVIELRTTQALRDHESLSVSLSLPAGFFDLRFLAGKTTTVDTVLFWLLLVGTLVYWLLFLRNRFFLPRQQAMPPLSANAGVVPYLMTGDAPDLAWLVMHWGSLGYLSIARTGQGKLYLKRQIDMGSERKAYEQRIFRSLFDRSDLCNAHGETYRRVRKEMPTFARGYWEGQLFREKGGRPWILRLLGACSAMALELCALDQLVAAQSWRWFLIVPLTALGGLAALLLQPVLTCRLRRRPARTLLLALPALVYLAIPAYRAGLGMLLFVCVLVQLLIGLGLLLGGKRKKQGQRLAEECFGLRRYLAGAAPEALRELLKDDPQFYYRMLPYADALRVGGRFTKKFGRLEPCTWLTGAQLRPKTAAGFWRLYLLVMDELREQTDAPLRNLIQNLRRRNK